MSKPATLTVLESVIDYTWREAQERARTREDHEDFSITLRLLGLLREGWTTGPGGSVFNLACNCAVGVPHDQYLRRKAMRAEFERLELVGCIPDFDPTCGRKAYGNQFLNLAASPVPADDSSPTRPPHENVAGTDFGFGMWAAADDQNPVSSRPGASSQTRLPAPDRRKPPQSFRSAAQRRGRAHALAKSQYFGA